MTRRPPLSRRALLSGLGALGFGTGVALATGEDSAADPAWPMYRYDSEGSAHNPDVSVPRSKPTEQWHHEFDDAGLRTPGPILYDGRVFVARESLTVFDAGSGDRQYRIESDGHEFLSTPTVAAARAYVSPSLVTASEHGLLAVGTDGGPDLPVVDSRPVPRWTTVDQPDNPAIASLSLDGRWEPPAVAAGETVLVAEDALVAIDASSGTTRWTKPLASYSRPAVVGDSVYTLSSDALRELSLEDGTERATERIDGLRPTAQPVVSNGLVYVAHDAGLTAFDTDGGGKRWTTEPSVAEYGRFLAPPAVTAEVAYTTVTVLYPDGSDGLVALDAETGDWLWDAELSSVTDDSDGPAVAGDVVVQPDNHDLRAFDAATGEPLWRIEREGQVSQPAIGDDRFYLAGGRGIAAFGGA